MTTRIQPYGAIQIDHPDPNEEDYAERAAFRSLSSGASHRSGGGSHHSEVGESSIVGASFQLSAVDPCSARDFEGTGM